MRIAALATFAELLRVLVKFHRVFLLQPNIRYNGAKI